MSTIATFCPHCGSDIDIPAPKSNHSPTQDEMIDAGLASLDRLVEPSTSPAGKVAIRLAAEYGYRQCEKGVNLEAMLASLEGMFQ